MRVVRGVVVAAVVGALALPAGAAPATHEVNAAGGPVGPTWRWEPAALEAARRDRVVWRNGTESLHHVAFYEGPLAGKTLHVAPGGAARLRLRKTGVYRYRCDIQTHSEIVGGVCVGQCGEITVE